MVSSWLLKVVIGILLVGFVAFELGSPLIVQTQADGAAHDIADEVAFRFDGLHTDEQFKNECETQARQNSVELVECTYDPNARRITVRVRKVAKSFVLKNFSATKGWYTREVTATSSPK